MGCSTFSNFTVLPEIAVAKIREDAPFKTSCYIGCGVTTGVGAVVNTAKVEPGDNVVVFGLGGIGLNVIQGAKLAGANKIVGVDINPDREEWGRKFGMTDFLNTKGMSREDIVAKIVEMTDGGADYTFDATGNTEVMRTALECCHRGWGTSIIIGVAEAGKEIATRPFQLVTGRNWRGTAFGGAKGRTDVPKIVDWYMDGKIADRPDDHPRPDARRDQQGLRPDARRRKHPERGRLLMSDKVNLAEKLASFSDHWAPRIVARYNDNEIRLVKVEGEFIWHSHDDTDELFLVIEGALDIELRDRTVHLQPGELFVVPRGTEHRPVSRSGETKLLLIDPRDMPNTGDEATATKAVEI